MGPLAAHFSTPRRFAVGLTAGTLLASSLAAVVVAPSAHAQVFDPFVQRTTVNAYATVEQVGNVELTCPPGSKSLDAGTPCAQSQAGHGPGNNDYQMSFVDVDNDASTFDSSTAQIDVPADADVFYAGLYWGANNGIWKVGAKGYGVNGENRLSCQVSEPSGSLVYEAKPMPDASKRDQAQVSVGGTTADVTALHVGQADPTNTGQGYQSVADVTSLVAGAGTGTHPVTVADVQAAQGRNCYGGWTLVLILTSKTGKATTWAPTFQNVTLFDGFARQKNGEAPTTMTVDGFVTPNSTYSAYLGDVSYEGDADLLGDSVTINGHALTEPRLGGTTNYYASTVTATTSPTKADGSPILDVKKIDPDYTDNLSFDSKVARADGASILGLGATSATIQTSTTGDTYYPGAFVFASQIQQSVLVKKLVDGRSDTTPTNPEPTGIGRPVTFTIPVTNSSDIPITNVTVDDTLDACLSYLPNTATVDGKSVTASVKGQTVTIPVGTLAGHGGTATAGLQATVKASCAGQVIANQALVNYSLHNGGPGTTPTNEVYVKAKPDALSIVKDHNPTGTVDFGDTITYDLTVSVPKDSNPQEDVLVSDAIPGHDPGDPASAKTTYVPGSTRCVGTLPSGATCVTGADVSASGVVTSLNWKLGTLQPGDSVQVEFKVKVDAIASTGSTSGAKPTIDNTAVASAKHVKPTPSNPVHNPVRQTKVLPRTITKHPRKPTTPTGPTLPRTGPGDAGPIGLVGLVLVGVGVTLVTTGRRRRGRLTS